MRLGSNGYTTDEGAFDAINAGTRQGVIYQFRDQLLALRGTGAAGGAKNDNQ